MRYLSIILIGLFLLAACKKEKYGNVRQQIKATSSDLTKNSKSLKSSQALRYTQFGDFITSITPTSCIGELNVVRFVSDSVGDYDFVTLVMRQPQMGEEPVMADFSNNAVISVVPEINGVNTIVQNSDGQGWFFKENVTMKLLWISMGLKQVIELPAEYANIQLNQFNPGESVKSGNILTTGMAPLNRVVSELAVFGGDVMNFYFGMTDNTYIDYGKMIGNNVATNQIRSSHYKEWTMTPPQPEETKTYISTIGFINDNIIQIYAGADNTPYTSDDIIVFEPGFWEKIYIDVNED